MSDGLILVLTSALMSILVIAWMWFDRDNVPRYRDDLTPVKRPEQQWEKTQRLNREKRAVEEAAARLDRLEQEIARLSHPKKFPLYGRSMDMNTNDKETEK